MYVRDGGRLARIEPQSHPRRGIFATVWQALSTDRGIFQAVPDLNSLSPVPRDNQFS
jgi:hypothetical protein